jgi:hypothetical protein
MEKIVIVYVVGDGYSYSGYATIATEYESVEAFSVDLEEDIINYIHGKPTKLNFDFVDVIHRVSESHVNFYKSNNIPVYKGKFGLFSYEMPKIYKLEDWFEKVKKPA